ncbi:MAG: bifunctional folylpolyglutamate synthase/dihydrofolate synthase [Deltaproteobacteria bacterium]|nr:bifunctional folylpolyglutamate synthase/dihydrofolate synthase [Deltaproteobacteria bacterium]
MTYQRAITYLFELQKFGIKLGLDNITRLLQLLGNPQQNLRCIHIAGTNGKGSTAAFLQSICSRNGLRAGLYTSPHLIDFTERIKINSHTITRKKVIALTKMIRRICSENNLRHITFFEFVTAMALCYFDEQNADPVIIETGLGGTYDATNIVTPLLSIITSIGLDHQQYLGNTQTKILIDKAGIIKNRTDVLSGIMQPGLKITLRQISSSRHSSLHEIGKQIRFRRRRPSVFNYYGLNGNIKDIQCGITGDKQFRNASLALASSELLRRKGYDFNMNAAKDAIAQTRLPGRLECVSRNPAIVLDGAHNVPAWRALQSDLKKYFSYKKLYFIIGIMADKDINQLIQILLPSAGQVVFCRPDMTRSADRKHLEKFVSFSSKNKVLWQDTTLQAIQHITAKMKISDLLCITGSFFTVGEAREYFLKNSQLTSGRIGL